MNNSIFQRIWLPGFLLQSVLIGGGYATGRELVEFFLSTGPVNGLFGMLLATVIFSTVGVWKIWPRAAKALDRTTNF